MSSYGTFTGGQRQLDEWADPDPWPFDHYGPTRRRPIPEPELKRTVEREKIRQYGFNLDCIHEADGVIPGVHTDFHPDDEHREDHYPDREKTVISRDLRTQRDAVG